MLGPGLYLFLQISQKIVGFSIMAYYKVFISDYLKLYYCSKGKVILDFQGIQPASQGKTRYFTLVTER